MKKGLRIKKPIIFVLIIGIISCKTTKSIELENHDVPTLKSHLNSVQSKEEIYTKYKDFYYGNSKYSVHEYYLSETEFKENQANIELMRIKVGQLLGPINNQRNNCSIFKNEKIETLNSTKLRYIFLPKETNPLLNQPISRNELMKLIEEGEDFVHLAKTYSKDPMAKINSGLYGWTIEGEIRSEIESKSKEVELFEVFEVISEVGTFICRIEETWKTRKLTKFIELEIKNCS